MSTRRVLDRISSRLTRKLLGTITHVSTVEPAVALTFDDGPHPDFTVRLLDILARYGAQATFFMVGASAARQPELVRQVARAGHCIGNHSYDHLSFPLLSSRERRRQLRLAQAAIAPYGQRLFRPPYGHQNLASRLDALRLGYQVVTWNVVANDWLDHDATWLTNRLTDQIRPGSIILLHDALFDAEAERFFDRSPTLEAIDLLLARLGHQFHFVTVPELFRRGCRQYRHWRRQPDLTWLNRLIRQNGDTRQDAPR